MTLPKVGIARTELLGLGARIEGDRGGVDVSFRIGKYQLRVSWDFYDPNWRDEK